MLAYGLFDLHSNESKPKAVVATVWPELFAAQAQDSDFILNVHNYHPRGLKDFTDSDVDVIAGFIQRLATNDCAIIFENSYGNQYIERFFLKIHEVLDALQISAERVTYVCSCIDAKDIYDRWRDRYGITDSINIAIVSYWEHLVRTSSKVDDTQNQYKPSLRSKKFLCVNQSYKNHRFALVMLLHHLDLLDKGLVSHVAFPLQLSDQDLHEQYHQQLSRELRDDRLSQIIADSHRLWGSDLNLVYPGHTLKQIVLNEDLAQYQNTGFSVISELVFFNHRGPDTQYQRSLTSRTFATIHMKHPFLLQAFSGALKDLRNLGYKTFEPMINESYDLMLNHSDRLKAVFAEIQRLCQMSDQAWLDWQWAVKPIVDYNFQVLMDKKNPQDFVLT